MTCIIIEDEIPAQRILQNHISKIPYLEIKGVFNAAIEAHQYLKNNSTDLIFLDINLPDISGLDYIKTVNNPPQIIMTTAYPDYAVDSFELDTIVDYLVKPIAFERFFKAVEKVNSKLKIQTVETEKENIIFLNVDKTHHKINLNNLLYVESDRNYVSLITTEKKFTLIDTLKNWREKLQSEQFVQIHKSYIINIDKVEKLSGNQVFIEGYRLPVGRTYKQQLLGRLKIT